MGLTRPLIRNAAFVYVVHWPALYHMTDPWRASRNFMVEWLSVRGHEEIVFGSEGNLRQYFYARLLSDRTHTWLIPNSIELPAHEPTPRAAGLPLRFLFLGRLEEQKKPQWLLHGWRAALDLGLRDGMLDVLGDGTMRQQMEELARSLGIADSVRFLGYQSNTGSHLDDCDVLLMTSVFEAHANVPLEAMAHGRPVIATAADGVQESFTDGREGFLVPLGDAQALGARIVQLARDPELRARMGAQGRLRARDFNPQQQREAYRSLLESVLQRRGRELSR